MKRITITALLALSLMLGAASPTKAQDNVPDNAEANPDTKAMQRTTPDPGVRSNEECPPDDMRCIVDRRLDELESEIQNIHDGYKDGSTWTKLKYKNNTNTKYGYKALHQIAMSPSYALKAMTWPVALAANELIEHGVVRKIVDVVSNDERTFWVYPKFELGFGQGFGGGVGVRHYNLFHKNFKFQAAYQINLRLDHDMYVSFGKPDIIYIDNKPLGFGIVTKYRRHNQDSYYGIGIGSPRSAKAKYGSDEYSIGGRVGYEFVKDLRLRFHTSFIWDDSRQGSGTPPANAAFPPAQLPGYGQSIYYLDFGLELVHDTRDCEAAPEHGGRRSFTFSRFQSLDTAQFAYNQYDVDVAQYIRIWRPRHVIVLRTAWSFQQTTDSTIPFYRLARLDVYSPLRSYDWGRYRDVSSAVFNIEYRFPVWDYLDGQFFYDTGRVFHNPQDFSFKHFKHSGGVGVRLRTSDYFLMRLQFAYGGEGANFLLKTSQAF
jgi:outer membrane protein assembly factor BamA